MYVRWQWKYQMKWGGGWRRHSSRQIGPFDLFGYAPSAAGYVVLVESVKGADGKPRQRHIAYLGSVRREEEQNDRYRALWWQHMSAKLDSLGNRIPHDERPRIEAALAMKVPRPAVR
jgi:hypothetical protein